MLYVWLESMPRMNWNSCFYKLPVSALFLTHFGLELDIWNLYAENAKNILSVKHVFFSALS